MAQEPVTGDESTAEAWELTGEEDSMVDVGKGHYLGSFDTKEAASQAYENAARKYRDMGGGGFGGGGGGGGGGGQPQKRSVPRWKPPKRVWVQCEKCELWRRLKSGVKGWKGEFKCSMNDWDEYKTCGMAQEPDDVDVDRFDNEWDSDGDGDGNGDGAKKKLKLDASGRPRKERSDKGRKRKRAVARAWVQGDQCEVWRRLASGVEEWGGKFECRMNQWDVFRKCGIGQEELDEEELEEEEDYYEYDDNDDMMSKKKKKRSRLKATSNSAPANGQPPKKKQGTGGSGHSRANRRGTHAVSAFYEHLWPVFVKKGWRLEKGKRDTGTFSRRNTYFIQHPYHNTLLTFYVYSLTYVRARE
jgi:hypothetical protein